jgi:hypothetical protein
MSEALIPPRARPMRFDLALLMTLGNSAAGRPRAVYLAENLAMGRSDPAEMAARYGTTRSTADAHSCETAAPARIKPAPPPIINCSYSHAERRQSQSAAVIKRSPPVTWA